MFNTGTKQHDLQGGERICLSLGGKLHARSQLDKARSD